VFVDGQNLFHAARAAFDCTYPDYDVHALGRAICASNGWAPSEIRFYTGLPEPSDNARWYRLWMAKLAAMGRQGVYVVSRPLRYRNQTARLPDGTEHTVLVGEEKGIDVAVVLSQDQDLAEVAEEIRVIAPQSESLDIACVRKTAVP